MLLTFSDELLKTPIIEQVFETRFFTVGAITMFDKAFDDGCCSLDTLIGLEHNAGVTGEVFVAGDATQFQPEVDACGEVGGGVFFFEFHCHEGNVVGVCDGGDFATPVKGNVELTR